MLGDVVHNVELVRNHNSGELTFPTDSVDEFVEGLAALNVNAADGLIKVQQLRLV